MSEAEQTLIFQSVYNQTANLMRRYCRSLTRKVHTAEDLFQETYLKVWRALARDTAFNLMAPQHVRAFVVRTAHNTFIDSQRKRSVKETNMDEWGLLKAPIVRDPCPHLLWDAITIIGKCTPRQQDILRSYLLEGERKCDIAKRLGIRANTLAACLMRALKTVRFHIELKT